MALASTGMTALAGTASGTGSLLIVWRHWQAMIQLKRVWGYQPIVPLVRWRYLNHASGTGSGPVAGLNLKFNLNFNFTGNLKLRGLRRSGCQWQVALALAASYWHWQWHQLQASSSAESLAT